MIIPLGAASTTRRNASPLNDFNLSTTKSHPFVSTRVLRLAASIESILWTAVVVRAWRVSLPVLRLTVVSGSPAADPLDAALRRGRRNRLPGMVLGASTPPQAGMT